MAPLTTTPSTRKGSAWTLIATKIVAQLWRASASSDPATSGRTSAAPTTSTTSTGRARVRPERREGSVVSAAGAAVTSRP